jgi:8-oxo-dGTP pyrophosphatase MutT (NUDIX family)
MSRKPWETLESELLVERRYLRVHTEKVRIASGVIIPDYHIIESPPWVGIVCVTEENELVLVEQYRHGHKGTSLELPAGIIEPGEDYLEGAERELQEETGYVSSEIEPLWKVRPEPARHDQWAFFVFARAARRAHAQRLDETEDIRVVTRSVAELDRVVDEMVHAVHVAALLLAARKGLLGER